MSISVRHEMRKGYLYFEVTGAFDIEEACGTFREGLEVVRNLGATKVLVDCLQLKGSLSTMDSYTYGEFIAAELLKSSRQGRKGTVHLAYLAVDPLRDRDHLGEVVATNRGVIMKSVESMEAALKWLGLEPEQGNSPPKA